MSDLPAYSGPPSSSDGYMNDSKEKVEITLYHSELCGVARDHSRSTQILFPSSISLLRVWTTGEGINGIEVFGRSGTCDLLGHRLGGGTTSHPHDVAFPDPRDGIATIQVRSGHWVDAIRVTSTVTNRDSGWIGGPGGSETTYTGILVGLVCEYDESIIHRFGVITANQYGDYSGFQQDVKQVEKQGRAAAATSQQVASSEGKNKSKFRWDTGRFTRHRGLGVRWNHERGRVEIYQGSNDANSY